MMDNVKKSKLTRKVINSNWKNEKIYINDSLTQSNKKLFFKTRDLLVIQDTNLFDLGIRKCI